MNDDVVKDATIHPADNSIESMEARLAKLNASLANSNISTDNMTKNSNNSIPPNVPPPFISGSRSSYNNGSDQHRLQNIHDGLKRLGVSISNNNNDSLITTTENLSEDEQVKLIIEQAQDEVRIERTEGRKHEIDNTSSVDSNNVLDYMNEDDDDIDENDSMFDDYEDEEDNIESLLMKAENLVAKTSAEIKGNMMNNTSSSLPISKEKVELAQLRKAQALLLEARLFLDMGSSAEEELDEGEDTSEKEISSSGKSTKEDATNNDKKVSSARINAKERVEDADKCLKEVLLGWG
jgi:hypothetical protein